jgi:heme/copper-type cytochrome/quinol oxidase subunit 1
LNGYSLAIRLELQSPGIQILSGANTLYNSSITIHGIIMIFFSVMPILIGGFGNLIVPLQLGTSEMAFPRLNNLSVWFLILSLITALFASGLLLPSLSGPG